MSRPGSAPEQMPLPAAVRGHTTRERPPPKPRPATPMAASGAVLVFDTETTIDQAQALTFGCWRYYRPHPLLGLLCAEEGLFYAEDLPDTDPAGMAILRQVAGRASSAAANGGPLRLLSRAEFVNRVFYPAAWENRATVVGFNVPFDIARVAIAAAEGRRSNLRGFSFTLAAGNPAKGYRERRHVPRVLVKHRDSHGAFIHFSGSYEQTAATKRWGGDFVDLRTLAYALTAQGHSLESACRTFGLPGKADPGGHGKITPAYVEYCRTDVARTAELYQACLRELAALNLPIRPAQLYSPAALSKTVLDALGVIPDADRPDPLPPEVQGWFMSAFYGGRAECRTRHTNVPISLPDYTSMYSTLFALMGLWDYCIAARLDTRDATDEVRAVLNAVTLETLFDPAIWPQLVGIALVQPDEDILPARAPYDERKTSWTIGVVHLTSDPPMWYTIPDLVASTLLTGKPPKIIKALKLVAHGRFDGLRPWTMPGGRVLDPTLEAPWPAMIEHRHRVRRNASLPPAERARIERFLKITASAGAYGIHAEYNRQDLPSRRHAEATVYSLDEQPFTVRIPSPEDPGRFCCPPLAAVITGGARLMLAMLERAVTDLGGAWAFADTDSMAIVATQDGGLVTCPGGPYRDAEGRECVRALSHHEVEGIRDRFARLNPYHPDAVPGSILKHELDAQCYAVAAKRYALYRFDAQGVPRLVPESEHQPCSHGLGHLLNPTDPDSEDRDWIRQFWEHHLAQQVTNHQPPAPDWVDWPALGKIAITSPATWRQLGHYNRGKPYRDQIKPFGFLLHAPGADIQDATGCGGRLVAPYTNRPDRWLSLDWIDLNNCDRPVKITTDPTRAGRALVDTYGAIADTYFSHREAKAANPDGTPADRASRGLLHRRHVYADSITIIGKEGNDLDERAAGLMPHPGEDPPVLVYRRSAPGALDAAELDRLRQIGAGRLAVLTRMSERRLRDILHGKTNPHPTTRRKLAAALQAERVSETDSP